jgi:PST family polysaccharide transporter
LARLLNPDTFGLVAIAGVYIAFIQVLVTQGFGMAIIQRSQIEREHLDSAFWIAMASALLFCLLSLLLGGQIARLFHEPRVAPVIGWLSLSFYFYALSSVPTAILTRELDFRALALRSLSATTVASVIGLAMAFFGCGVWSLVGQQLANALLGCVCLWRAVSWRPRLRISRRHLGDLYGFSLSITGNDVLWFFSQKSDQTFVGYGFGPLGLGPYSLASRLTTFLYDGITGVLSSVAFPAFSKLQSAPLKFEQALHKFCEICSFVSFPVFAGLMVVAPDFVPCLFGAKWASAVPIVQILAAYGALRSALGFVHPLLLSTGRAGLFFLNGVILTCLTFAGCLVAVRWSPAAIALSIVFTMLLYAAVFLVIAQRVLKIRIRPLLETFTFPGLSSLFMLIVVALLRGFISKIFAPAVTVTVCVAAGALVYSLTALYGRPDLVKAIWELAGKRLLPSGRVGRLETPPLPAKYIAKATPGSPEP